MLITFDVPEVDDGIIRDSCKDRVLVMGNHGIDSPGVSLNFAHHPSVTAAVYPHHSILERNSILILVLARESHNRIDIDLLGRRVLSLQCHLLVIVQLKIQNIRVVGSRHEGPSFLVGGQSHDGLLVVILKF